VSSEGRVDVVMTTSASLEHRSVHVSARLDHLRAWLAVRGHASMKERKAW
jgi:hypothetical protein